MQTKLQQRGVEEKGKKYSKETDTKSFERDLDLVEY